jgi:hypothetical protein
MRIGLWRLRHRRQNRYHKKNTGYRASQDLASAGVLQIPGSYGRNGFAGELFQ